MTPKHPDVGTYFGGGAMVVESAQERAALKTPIRISLSYSNHTPQDLTVVTRLGFPFTVPSSAPSNVHNFKPVFIARLEVDVRITAYTDLSKFLTTLDENCNSQLKMVREAFVKQVAQNRWNGGTMVFEYALTLDQIKKYGGALYYKELDIVVSTYALDEGVLHPFSQEGEEYAAKKPFESNTSSGSFIHTIQIIDNQGLLSPRFVNVCNKVYKILPIMDQTKEDGLYVYSNDLLSGNVSATQISTQKYSLAEIDKLEWLYRSHDEAEKLGNIEAINKREIMDKEKELREMEHENKRLSFEHNKLKWETDTKTLALEKAAKEADYARERYEKDLAAQREIDSHERELTRMKLKEQYERKSLDRRDFSDALKWAPTVIIGIGGLVVAVKSLLTNKDK